LNELLHSKFHQIRRVSTQLLKQEVQQWSVTYLLLCSD